MRLLAHLTAGLVALIVLLVLAFDFIYLDLARVETRREAVRGAVSFMGPAWPGSSVQVRESGSDLVVERTWLGLLEQRIPVEQRDGDWFILPELETGPANALQHVLVLLAAILAGYLLPLPFLWLLGRRAILRDSRKNLAVSHRRGRRSLITGAVIIALGLALFLISLVGVLWPFSLLAAGESLSSVVATFVQAIVGIAMILAGVVTVLVAAFRGRRTVE